MQWPLATCGILTSGESAWPCAQQFAGSLLNCLAVDHMRPFRNHMSDTNTTYLAWLTLQNHHRIGKSMQVLCLVLHLFLPNKATVPSSTMWNTHGSGSPLASLLLTYAALFSYLMCISRDLGRSTKTATTCCKEFSANGGAWWDKLTGSAQTG